MTDVTTAAREAAFAWLKAQIGKPYSETLDGGVGPNYYDCSGLVQQMAKSQGVNIQRTTSTQWAELEHLDQADLELCDLVYFHVPSDGGPTPQHVGVWIGPGQIIEAPHTGAFVQYAGIPNNASESIWGYARIPWPGVPVNPNPIPPAQPIYPPNLTELLMPNPAIDPETGGSWTVDPTDGHVECWPANWDGSGPMAPYCGGLNNPPDSNNWKETGFITGIVPLKGPDGRWGYGIQVRHNQPFGPSGAWYSSYFFPRPPGE